MPPQLSESVFNPGGKKKKHQQCAGGAKVIQQHVKALLLGCLVAMSKCIKQIVQPELLGLC